MFRSIFILVSFILLAPSFSLAQGMTSAQIDSILKVTLEVTPSVGIAVAVVKDGEVVHSKGYGKNSINQSKKVDDKTLFAIASNSKAFTTAALAILVDEGKLNWDDKVIDHLPRFRMYDDYLTANFTIIDLLTHRSGLDLGAGDLMLFPDGGDYNIDDVLSSFQFQEPVSGFRTKYDYDNLLYIVAGEIIAQISGMSWGEFVQKRIFDPLGMQFAVPTPGMLNGNEVMAMPHDSDGDKIKEVDHYNNDLTAAAGGILASVNDLSKWMLVQLNQGKYGKDLSKELFSETQQNEMWKPHTIIGFQVNADPRKNTHLSAYGLGWKINDVAGRIVLSHTGGYPGMLSKTILVPEENLGIVVLTNSLPGGAAYYSVPETILDYYLDIDKRDWITLVAESVLENGNQADSVVAEVWKVVEKNRTSKMDYSPYIGTYSDDWFGDIEVSMKGGKLWFTSKRSPKLNGEMFHYKANTFAIKWEYTEMHCDAFAMFSLDEQGKAIGIKMKGISPNIDFSFDFQHLDFERVKE